MQFEFLTDGGASLGLVRFFMLDQKQFLIYSDNNEGIDEQGHLTIHISEIKHLDHIVGDTVSDTDWEAVKNIIKTIVNANKNNQTLPIQDMDYNVLNGLTIVGNRALKLMSSYVDLLKANQPIFEKNIVEDIIKPAEDNVVSQAQNVPVDSLDINTNVEPIIVDNNMNQSDFQNSGVVPSEFNNSTSLASEPTFDNQASSANVEEDYRKKYEEQIELISQMKEEITEYRNKFETLKNIINN